MPGSMVSSLAPPSKFRKEISFGGDDEGHDGILEELRILDSDDFKDSEGHDGAPQ